MSRYFEQYHMLALGAIHFEGQRERPSASRDMASRRLGRST